MTGGTSQFQRKNQHSGGHYGNELTAAELCQGMNWFSELGIALADTGRTRVFPAGLLIQQRGLSCSRLRGFSPNSSP